jgi:DNA-binding HxlR family transcriptional regulator
MKLALCKLGETWNTGAMTPSQSPPVTLFRSGCPIASALDLVGDRWTMVIVRSMVMGARSYSDLLAAPERIATNILADRLRRMEEAGLIVRADPAPGPARGAYALTPMGAGLIPAAQALARWAEAHIPGRWPTPERFNAANPEDFVAADPPT